MLFPTYLGFGSRLEHDDVHTVWLAQGSSRVLDVCARSQPRPGWGVACWVRLELDDAAAQHAKLQLDHLGVLTRLIMPQGADMLTRKAAILVSWRRIFRIASMLTTTIDANLEGTPEDVAGHRRVLHVDDAIHAELIALDRHEFWQVLKARLTI